MAGFHSLLLTLRNCARSRAVLQLEVLALHHVIVFSATGLPRLMQLYPAYDERSRPQRSLEKDAPMPRSIALPTEGCLVAIPQGGGLHHRYARRAA